jgi:hypothetical protein
MKTLDDLKKEVNHECWGKRRSDDRHCDTWDGSNFTVSEDGKIVAYIMKRMYEVYNSWPHDQDYNQICVVNLETGLSIKSTSLDKFLEYNTIWEEKLIDDILSVSNEGSVSYKTRNGKTLTF